MVFYFDPSNGRGARSWYRGCIRFPIIDVSVGLGGGSSMGGRWSTEMPAEPETARKRGRERERAMRESVIREDRRGEDEMKDSGGREEGGEEEDSSNLVNSEGVRVGNGLEALLMGDECDDRCERRTGGGRWSRRAATGIWGGE